MIGEELSLSKLDKRILEKPALFFSSAKTENITGNYIRSYSNWLQAVNRLATEYAWLRRRKSEVDTNSLLNTRKKSENTLVRKGKTNCLAIISPNIMAKQIVAKVRGDDKI